MKKIIVTAKGAALKCNSWVEGQIISCHENLAEAFINSGYASEIGAEKTKEDKTVKQTKSKN